MATPNLIQQGILVADKQHYSPNSHVNSVNLFNASMRNGVEMDNMGLIKTWSQIFRNVQPLYNFDQIAKQTRYVDSDKGFTWNTSVTLENPKIVEDLSGTDKAGQDGIEFKLAFDKPFTVTQTITFDHINSKFHLQVTEEPYADGDRWIHTLKIQGPGSKTAYISKEFLTPGTEYYQISSYRGDEYDTVAASFQSQTGERTWHYYLGNSEVAYDLEFSKKALLMAKSGKYHGQDLRVWELYKMGKGSDGFNYLLGDPSANITQILSGAYKGDKKAMKADIVAKNWFFEIEKATLDKVMYDWTMNLMWGVGGRTQVQYDTISVSPGLYWQHKTYGTVVNYNLNQFTLDFLRSRIEAHFKHRLDFNADGVIMLKVGAGLYNLLETEIKKEFNGVGLVVDDVKRFLEGSRFELNFAMRFNAFFLKQFPRVKVLMVHEPALDPVFANDISNPIIDKNHRLTSFTGIIYDLNDIESDNIQLVKWSGDDKLRYMKQIGNIDWDDQNATFFSSGNFSGVRGTMSLRHAGIWLVDPTKSLMFEAIDPRR